MIAPRSDYRALSIAERIVLVEDIWDSIAEEVQAQPATADDKAYVAERLKEIRRCREPLVPWDEVKRRARRGRAQR